MEQNNLESVHTILCQAVSGNFPGWKERSRMASEIAFILKRYMIQNDCSISVVNNQIEFVSNKNNDSLGDESKSIIETIKSLIK